MIGDMKGRDMKELKMKKGCIDKKTDVERKRNKVLRVEGSLENNGANVMAVCKLRPLWLVEMKEVKSE